jgi:biotin transport system substrate-specific component
MTNPVAPAHRLVLADRFVSRSLVTDAALVVGGVAFTGLMAQVEIPLWPVPITGQTLAVMLVGSMLGARRGALSLTLYLVLGLVGVPLFAGLSGGTFALPSFGFIIGFIPAAALIGWLSERTWDRRFPLALGGFLLASAIPFVVGLPYLAVALAHLGLPHGFGAVMAAGFTPFIVGGIAKWLIAAGTLPLLWRAARRLKRR